MREYAIATLCFGSRRQYLRESGTNVFHPFTALRFHLLPATATAVDGDIHLNHQVGREGGFKGVRYGDPLEILGPPGMFTDSDLGRFFFAPLTLPIDIDQVGAVPHIGPDNVDRK